jgi:Tol biopolymer transport system component
VLTARSFDPITVALSGEPAVIAQDVPAVEPPAAFSVSSTGAIAFSRSTSADSSRLKWFDRNGKELGQLGPRSYGSNISISPDGRLIAFDTIESDRRSRHIWTADPIRNLATVMNSGPREWVPIASSDGFVAFTSTAGVYMALPSATGPPEALYRAGKPKAPNDWSPDGRFLTFNELHPTRRSDLYVMRLEGREPIPLVVTDADELPAVFSPDGKWIAYSSDETGNREVYVRDFAPDRTPAVGDVKVRVSTEGGDKPDWSADGAELYYISADGRLTVVAVKTTPTFVVGSPVALFEVHVPKGSFFPYAVAHDGRFLVDTLDGPSIDPLAGMTVILNWMSR